MLRRPENDFNEHRREIAALRRELVDGATAVFRIVAAFDDLQRFKPLEPVGKDVGRDSLAALEELSIGRLAEQQHVADQEQRPAVAENLQRDADRTMRTTIRGFVFYHNFI